MPPKQYQVHVVEDAALPADQDWIILEVDGRTHCVLRGSRICPAVLEEAWVGMGCRREQGLLPGSASILHQSAWPTRREDLNPAATG